jgi:hypothetical protein
MVIGSAWIIIMASFGWAGACPNKLAGSRAVSPCPSGRVAQQIVWHALSTDAKGGANSRRPGTGGARDTNLVYLKWT